jgi:hypothetical protein
VEHRPAKRFADEVARLVDGDVVRGPAVTIHDEDPLEAVLRDLSPKIGTSDLNVDCRMPYVPGWTSMSPSWLAPPWP